MPETYAYFFVDGFDCDPSVISSHLALSPTKVWRKGDPHPKRKNHFFERSCWQLESTTPRETCDLGAPVSSLVNLLLEKAELIATLPSHKSKGINCVGYYFSENPGFSLPAELSSKLGRLNVDVDFDLYNLRDSDELWFIKTEERQA